MFVSNDGNKSSNGANQGRYAESQFNALGLRNREARDVVNLCFEEKRASLMVVGDTLSNVASGGLGSGVIRYSSSNTMIATVDVAGRLTVASAPVSR